MVGATTGADTDRADTALEWGDMASAAREAGALGPAWKKFIKTKFFVPILRSPDGDPKNFLLHVVPNADGGQATLTVSEVRERLDRQQGDGIVALSGADIVRRLQDQGGIDVALRDGVFRISSKRALWLRSGINVTMARIAVRNRLRAAAPAAPLPVLVAAPELAPAANTLAPPAPSKPAGRARYAMPAALSLAALGVIAAIVVKTSPEPASAPPPFEAPIPARTAATTAPAAAAPARPALTFTAAYNSFTVTLPGLAEEVELSPEQIRSLGNVEMHQYRLRADEGTYAMEASLYRAGVPQNLAAGMDMAQAAIVGKDGTLIRAVPVSLRGATGREVRVRLPNGGERAARFAFSGNKFCMVMLTAPDGARSARRIDAFLNSFQLN